MDIVDKIKLDNSIKSKQVRKLRKKIGKRISLQKLQTMLNYENTYEVNALNYMGLYEFEDTAYNKDVARKEARKELLEELINIIK